MPETTITIDRDQRDGLYELVRNHLGSIEDFWVALERTRDFARAEQLCRHGLDGYSALPLSDAGRQLTSTVTAIRTFAKVEF